MPAISTVGAPYAHFDPERFSALERCAPGLVIALHVGRMKVRKSLGPRTRRLFQREAHIVLPGPIHESAGTVRPIRCNEDRDGVDRQLQVALSIGKPSLTFPKRRFSPLAL